MDLKSSIDKAHKDLDRWEVTGKKYHSQLPDDAMPWYVYTQDGGHSAFAIAEFHARAAFESDDPTQFLIPMPVKIVLRGYRVRDGFLVVDAPYDNSLGLLTSDEDHEFD